MHLANANEVHRKSGDPDFLYAALDTPACAAFVKESRMNFANAHRLHRKPGGKAQRDVLSPDTMSL
jgi:hypothetical protein